MGENEKTYEQERELEEVETRMRAKYKCPTNHPLAAVGERTQWEGVLPNRSLLDFKGKSILDLGCGSEKSHDQCPPWFCRATKEVGAQRVVGIDIASNNGEEFEHYQMDLTNPENLSMFGDESFDYANSSRFIFPPEKGAATSPVLLAMTTSKQLGALPTIIQKQIERILKDGGIYMTDEGIVFVKKDGKLSCEGDWLELSMKKEGRPKEEIERIQRVMRSDIEITPDILELMEQARQVAREEMRREQ